MRYTINTASVADLARHLWACSADFTPPLSEKVDIEPYAEKLWQRAVNFEAWEGDALVGMVNAYLNDLDNRKGYITNVSTLRSHTGRGIGAQLLSRCIDYAQAQGFHSISLEVNAHSPGAVRLYERHGFGHTGQEGDMLKMNCLLSKT